MDSKRAKLLGSMKGLWFDGKECKLVENLPIPSLSSGEALIQIELAGICATDAMILNGYKTGFRGVLGHEFVGKLVELNGNSQITVGQRVVASINIAMCCKSSETKSSPCEFCIQMPHGNHCSNRQVVGIYNHDGAFAQYLAIPIKNLYVVPENLPSRVAVFTEPLAAAYRAVEQAEEWLHKNWPDTTTPVKIAVMGDGKLGNLIVQALRTAFPTAHIHVFGRHFSKMAPLCRLTNCYFWNESIIEHYSAYFHVAIEATGSPQGIQRALQLVKPRGMVILKSTCSPTRAEFTGLSTESINDLVVREITVCGSRCGPFNRALFALQHNQVKVDALVERVCPLSEEALRLAATRGVRKVLIEM